VTRQELAIAAEQLGKEFLKSLQALHADVDDPLMSQVLLKSIEQTANINRSLGLVGKSLQIREDSENSARLQGMMVGDTVLWGHPDEDHPAHPPGEWKIEELDWEAGTAVLSVDFRNEQPYLEDAKISDLRFVRRDPAAALSMNKPR